MTLARTTEKVAGDIPSPPRCDPSKPLSPECLGNAGVAGLARSESREGERCACGGIIGPDGMCDRCRARQQAAAGLARSSILGLQRAAGNQALARLLARAPSARAAGPVLARQPTEPGPYAGEGAGCGICQEPAVAGQVAHTLVQSGMGQYGVDSELSVAAGSGAGGRGRLDLGRWDDTTVEIGEIKPGHDDGMALGESDLAYYEGVLKKTQNPKFKGKEVKRLDVAVPAPQPFPNEGVALPAPQMMLVKKRNGVYGYWCDPSNNLLFQSARQSGKGPQKVTKDALKKMDAFWDSPCIRERKKVRPREVERVRVQDRAGARRFVSRAMAVAILQSRAYHVRHELTNLSGEHAQARKQSLQMLAGAALLGGPIGLGIAGAALWTGMPDVAIWDAAKQAAAQTEGATELEALAHSLHDLEQAMTPARQQFLEWKARRDGTPQPVEPNTPAPATGAGAPPAAAPPPVPPQAAPAQTAPPAQQQATTPAPQSGLSNLEIAALVGIVVLSCLILQPEVGVAAVEVAEVAEGAELVGGAAETAEAGLIGGSEAFEVEEIGEVAAQAARGG